MRDVEATSVLLVYLGQEPVVQTVSLAVGCVELLVSVRHLWYRASLRDTQLESLFGACIGRKG